MQVRYSSRNAAARRAARLAVLLAATLVVTGCVAEPPKPAPSAPSRTQEPEPRPMLSSRATLPGEPLTVVAGADPVGNSIAASAALYAGAQFVITAPEGDLGAQLLASSAAVALGVPLLLTPATDAADRVAPVEAELDRLGATHVLSVDGETPTATPLAATGAHAARELLHVAATATALAAILPGNPKATPVSAEGALAAVAGQDPHSPLLLSLEPGAPRPTATNPATNRATNRPAVPSHPTLPRVRRATPLTGGLVIAVNDPAQLAGAATARSTGTPVLVVPADRPNPQASAALVTALADARPTAVIALGAPFAGEAGLEWKIRSAATGTQLPGGGQQLFPGRLLVALYGTPGTSALGVLGEQELSAAIVRAKSTAAEYATLTDRPVVPMMEIIATVAAGAVGSDGNYSNEISAGSLRPWVEAAGAAGMYVVLDLQPGRTDFLTQAKRYESLLELPHVGLALDPEWRLGRTQRHLEQIGSVDAAELNSVITWLADLTNERALPQKLLVLHQFSLKMIRNRAALDTSRAEIALLLHVDGLGGQPAKQATWRALQVGAPEGIAWGWKNFIDEDRPMLTPRQTMSQVAPIPDLITYQ